MRHHILRTHTGCSTSLLASFSLSVLHLKSIFLIIFISGSTPTVLSALSQFLVKEAGKEPTLTAALTVPVLDTLTAMLRQGEGMLSNPHHVTMVLGALQFVPLEHLTMEIYHTTFEAIHEALFAVIQCHPQVSGLGSINVTSCIFYVSTSTLGTRMVSGGKSTQLSYLRK